LIGERGADLAFHDFGANGGDGLYLWNGNRGLIVLNAAGRKPTRLRFTAAHELGHHEMHRHTMPSVLLSDEDVLHEEQTDIEKEANSFAAELLAPQAALRRELDGRDSASITPVDVVQLMRSYGLSYESTLWRLFNSSVITMPDKDRLTEEGRGRVGQIEAALGFDEKQLFGPPRERLPEEFVLDALRVYREGAVDKGRLSELLRRPPEEALKLAQEIEPEPDAHNSTIDKLLDI
jgi:hypothetical protein